MFANFLNPRSATRPTTDVRVQDYLNDKFQTLADLEQLNSLLESVQKQQTQLREQLAGAETTVNTTRTELTAHSAKLNEKVNEFQVNQEIIDKRLQATTAAETATEAAEQFGATIEKLHRLDVAEGYVKLLKQVDDLSKEAHKKIDQGRPEEALIPYNQLQELTAGVKARNDSAEGVAVHLVSYVEKATEELWSGMKGRLAGNVEQVLAKMNWPTTEVVFPVKVEEEFRLAFEKLLALQPWDLPKEQALLPFEVLVKPLALRFRYHFEGDKPTNRADKPEWFLAHLTELITTYTPFLTHVIEPILASSPNELINTRDVINEFITALLPIVRRKTQRLLPNITGDAQLLSHFIHELVKFDAELREEFYYAPFGCDGLWKGMTHEVLVVENGFPGWLHVEKEFALSRYHSILDAPDAWVIDYDIVEASESKPTKSATRLKDLLETVTESYRPLISFSQKLRFLIDIQVAILDQYHDRLNGSVEAFRVLSSSLARAVQGTSKEEVESLSGLGGLERLCKAYGSAIYLENCMRDWNEDIFFLELWEELEARANKSPNKTVAGSMNIQEVAAATSSTLVNGDDDSHDGALFDETAESYRRLCGKTEELIIEHITQQVKNELRPYLKINNWSSLDPAITDISAELVSALTTISQSLDFLQRAISPVAYRRITRAIATSVQNYIWDYLLSRQLFSLAGACQFARDVQELWGISTDMPRLREATVLLTLPVEAKEGEVALRDVVKPVFEDNVSARDMMNTMGIVTLQVGEVRTVLQRRIEAFGSA
ncbi:TIP-1 family-domain-containing protein [Pyronema omphalodes]|nr:TIP-1 family-domain-containing protein [Pyronema omphalodes]